MLISGEPGQTLLMLFTSCIASPAPPSHCFPERDFTDCKKPKLCDDVLNLNRAGLGFLKVYTDAHPLQTQHQVDGKIKMRVSLGDPYKVIKAHFPFIDSSY